MLMRAISGQYDECNSLMNWPITFVRAEQRINDSKKKGKSSIYAFLCVRCSRSAHACVCVCVCDGTCMSFGSLPTFPRSTLFHLHRVTDFITLTCICRGCSAYRQIQRFHKMKLTALVRTRRAHIHTTSIGTTHFFVRSENSLTLDSHVHETNKHISNEKLRESEHEQTCLHLNYGYWVPTSSHTDTKRQRERKFQFDFLLALLMLLVLWSKVATAVMVLMFQWLLRLNFSPFFIRFATMSIAFVVRRVSRTRAVTTPPSTKWRKKPRNQVSLLIVPIHVNWRYDRNVQINNKKRTYLTCSAAASSLRHYVEFACAMCDKVNDIHTLKTCMQKRNVVIVLRWKWSRAINSYSTSLLLNGKRKSST